MKIRLYCYLLLLICTRLQAQTAPSIVWQKSLGGSLWDQANSIRQTSDGGFIIAGHSFSNDGDVSGNHGGRDCWIVKLDSFANVQWQKCFGGSSTDDAQCIQQTIDGGFIVAGGSYSNDGDVSGNHGDKDYLIVKLDSSGNVQWQKCLGGSSFDWAHSIKQTSDGGFIVAGYSFSNDGDISGYHGTADYWIVKLDSSGNVQWQKSLGGSNFDAAYSIQQTVDGGFIVAGCSQSYNGDVTVNMGLYDYWIVKLDSSANIEWQKSLGGSNYDQANDILQTADGGSIITGYSESSDGDISDNHGYPDYWIVKLDSLGNLQWQKSLGGTKTERAESIQQTFDGGLIVGGYSSSNDGDVSSNQGSFDYWIVKLDSSANIQWQKPFGGSNYDAAYSVQQTSDSGYIVVGYSDSHNGDVSNNHGENDSWIVKIGECTQGLLVYGDNDDDGYGNTTDTLTIYDCPILNGYVLDNSDCDDTDPNIHPNSFEISDNGIDDDCDGEVDEFGVGFSELTESTSTLSAFPNPTEGKFTLFLNLLEQGNTEAKIEVLNLLGQIITSENGEMENGELQKEIQLSDAVEGTYLVKVIIGDRVYTSQINLQK